MVLPQIWQEGVAFIFGMGLSNTIRSRNAIAAGSRDDLRGMVTFECLDTWTARSWDIPVVAKLICSPPRQLIAIEVIMCLESNNEDY